MISREKAVFLAESLDAAIKKHSEEVRKRDDALFKKIVKEEDYKGYTAIMTSIIKESVNIMDIWEQSAMEKLENKTPKEYFSSIDNLDDGVLIIAAMIEKNGGMLPPSLIESIEGLEESISDQVIAKINSIMPGKEGILTVNEKAELKIAEIIASEKFTDPLSKLLFRLDPNAVAEDTVECIMDALRELGKPSIPCLIAVCEKCNHKGIIYMHAITALGQIASKDKSEEIYRYLKECFRKSEGKLVEAGALGIYGDGRAIAALRTYVERNIANMGEGEYTTFRDIILQLGGIMTDLDRKYFYLNR